MQFDREITRFLGGPKNSPAKARESFQEEEDARTVAAVLKQNLRMGVITQEEYDQIAKINEASFGAAPVGSITVIKGGGGGGGGGIFKKAANWLTTARDGASPPADYDAPSFAFEPGTSPTRPAASTAPPEPSPSAASLASPKATKKASKKSSAASASKKKARRRKIVDTEYKQNDAADGEDGEDGVAFKADEAAAAAAGAGQQQPIEADEEAHLSTSM